MYHGSTKIIFLQIDQSIDSTVQETTSYYGLYIHIYLIIKLLNTFVEYHPKKYFFYRIALIIYVPIRQASYLIPTKKTPV